MRIKPCFYHNIEEEIPAPHQQLVRRVYTLWMSEFVFFTNFVLVIFQMKIYCYVTKSLPFFSFSLLSTSPLSSLSPAVYSGTLCINVISCIAWWAGGGNASNFGFSLLWLILFSPCSYTCWFRPLYKAFRLVTSGKCVVNLVKYVYWKCKESLHTLRVKISHQTLKYETSHVKNTHTHTHIQAESH